MAIVTIKPTTADKRVANAIASHTTPDLERAAQFLTWGADEKLLLLLAVGGWIYASMRPALRPIGVSVMPGLMPLTVTQYCPTLIARLFTRAMVPPFAAA